jgi:small subunit ribosomal protein S20
LQELTRRHERNQQLSTDHHQYSNTMPNTASAKKRMRQDAVRRARNRSTKSSLRTQLRKLREAIKAKKLDESQSEYRTLVKKLDQAAGNKVIHANAAARTKSRLSNALKALKAK